MYDFDVLIPRAATVDKLAKDNKTMQLKLDQLNIIFRTNFSTMDDTVAKKVVEIEDRFDLQVLSAVCSHCNRLRGSLISHMQKYEVWTKKEIDDLHATVCFTLLLVAN